MRFWLLMLGGLLVWAAHFMGLYLLSSAADVAREDAGAWNALGLTFSALCLASIGALCWKCLIALRAKPEATQSFGLRLAIAGSLLGAIGVVFQTLVLVVGGRM
ncbi:hypothetical protein OIU13_14465 [Brevundimonas sp. BT-123]|uniref:hypothetical protein n=1 Tax=Brevundimonas sp. BT-123 TaxID=2986928 RepID=UPI0022368DF9|nr:hypothetical protein [Brevundimonas sp. BT-123]MCW0047733.1 hypothetical protein [Brevundimonas sp. BT-123]